MCLVHMLLTVVFVLWCASTAAKDGPENVLTLPVVEVGTSISLEEGQKLQAVLSSVGAFFVKIKVDNGPEVVHGGFRAAKKLFAEVTSEEKSALRIQNGGFTRGFVPLGGESGSPDRVEVKEAFSYGFDWESVRDKTPSNALEGSNTWPSSFPSEQVQELNDMFGTFVRAAEATVKDLFGSMPGLENLGEICKGGETISLMRVFHYFPINSKEYIDSRCTSGGVSCIGSSLHTDWGLLTFIIADDLMGLQFELNGTFYDVKAEVERSDDSSIMFLVNVGDYLSLMTDENTLVSPLHRVVLTEKERLSFVFFYYPGFHSKLPQNIEKSKRGISLLKDQSKTPPPPTTTTKRRAKPTCFGEFILDKWSQVFREKEERKNEDDPTLIIAVGIIAVLCTTVYLSRQQKASALQDETNRLETGNIYELVGGESGVKKIADQFYTNLKVTEIHKLFKDDPIHRREILFQYLSGEFGGPELYLERKGTKCLQKTHKMYNISNDQANTWLKTMKQSLRDCDLDEVIVERIGKIFLPLAKSVLDGGDCSDGENSGNEEEEESSN